jgi:hypothetical protein
MEFEVFKRDAIQYWEKRRVIWNLLLVLPAYFSYSIGAGLAAGIGDTAAFGLPMVLAMFCFAAVGANICYCFAYVAEFWLAGTGAEKTYRENGRLLLFILGCLIGLGLAFSGGSAIALAQYPT